MTERELLMYIAGVLTTVPSAGTADGAALLVPVKKAEYIIGWVNHLLKLPEKI